MGKPLANYYHQYYLKHGTYPDFTIVSDRERRKWFNAEGRDAYGEYAYIDIPSPQQQTPTTTTVVRPYGTVSRAPSASTLTTGNSISSGPTITPYGNSAPGNIPSSTTAPPSEPSSTGPASLGGGGGGGGGIGAEAEKAVDAVQDAAKKNPYLKYGLIGAGILVVLYIIKKVAS